MERKQDTLSPTYAEKKTTKENQSVRMENKLRNIKKIREMVNHQQCEDDNVTVIK